MDNNILTILPEIPKHVKRGNSETIYQGDLISDLNKLWNLKGKSICLSLDERIYRWNITKIQISQAGFPNTERFKSTWYMDDEIFNSDIKYVFGEVNRLTGTNFDLSKLLYHEGRAIEPLIGYNSQITFDRAPLACLITHVRAWLDLLNSDYDYYIYFEDDVEFIRDFAKNFLNMMYMEQDLEMKNAISKWDAFFIDTFLLNWHSNNIITSFPAINHPNHNIILEKLTKSFARCHFVIIKKDNVQKILQSVFPSLTSQIDTLIYKSVDKFNLNLYSINGLTRQDVFCSDVQSKINMESYQEEARNDLLKEIKSLFPNINADEFIYKYIDIMIIEKDFNPQELEYVVKDEHKDLKNNLWTYLYKRRRGEYFNNGTSNYLLNLLETLAIVKENEKLLMIRRNNTICKLFTDTIIENKVVIEKSLRLIIGLGIGFYFLW
jgi:GR25 family glycosyltransferase involved in LPS biosynthesis